MMNKRTPSISVALCLLSAAVFAAPEALSGKALFENKCSTCHETKNVLRMKRDKKGWKVSIVEMRQNGAQVSNAEADAIANYLVKAAGR